MDTDLMSCSKCGHTVKDGADACAYCGTAVSSADSPLQPDELAPGSTEQAAEPSPVPSVDAEPVLDATEEKSAGESDISAEQPKAGPSSQSQPEVSQPATNESAMEAVSGATDQASAANDDIDFELPDDELIVEFEADDTATDSKPASGGDTGSAGLNKPDTSSGQGDLVELEQHADETAAEVIPLSEKVSAKAATDDSPGLPPTPVLDVSGEDPSESETLGADILELVEDEASEPEAAQEVSSEAAKSSDEPVVEKKTDAGPDQTSDDSGIQDGELEAILLTPGDEVQSAAPSIAADVEENPQAGKSGKPAELAAPTAKAAAKSDDSSAPGDAQAKADAIQKQTEAQATLAAVNIEKAAQESAAGRTPQKAAADANLLKKQKAALAKAQALKKKKLKLAKAQALKRKKAAMAKAQALKKQKKAQAGIEKANKQRAASSILSKVDNPNVSMQSMEANTKMLGLLKKYEGQPIGINYDNSADIKEAELVEANDEFFSVFVKDQELNYSHPLKTILTIIEGQDGVETGKSEQKAKFNAVIKVYPLVLF